MCFPASKFQLNLTLNYWVTNYWVTIKYDISFGM